MSEEYFECEVCGSEIIIPELEYDDQEEECDNCCAFYGFSPSMEGPNITGWYIRHIPARHRFAHIRLSVNDVLRKQQNEWDIELSRLNGGPVFTGIDLTPGAVNYVQVAPEFM